MKEQQIVSLKGPDRVRKRPAVVFGTNDADGAFAVFKTLMNVLVREAILGYCDKLSVAIHDDGSISIYTNDRGINLDEAIIDSKPMWQNIFCDFGAAPREPDENYYDVLAENQDKLYGCGMEFPEYPNESDCMFDLCCVQYVCKYLTVESTRDGIRKSASFKKGYPSSELKKSPGNESTGTTIHFKIDSDVFTEIKIPYEAAERYLQVLAITVRGLACKLNIDEYALSLSYQYQNGIVDYMNDSRCYFKEKEAIGKDRYDKAEYKARVRIAVRFDHKLHRNECFHNYCEVKRGGTHLEAVRAKIRRYLEWYVLTEGFDDVELADHLMKHIDLAIETNCSLNSTSWLNARRDAISNTMIADFAADLIDDDFSCFLKQNRTRILSVLD